VLDEALSRDANYAAILVTGDLVQDDASGYLRFKSILGNLRKPVLCVPGNHDEPDAMRLSLATNRFSTAVRANSAVGISSCWTATIRGMWRTACRERTRTPDEALKNSPAHALVCLHHHPVAMGSRWLDGIGLANAAEFWRVIDSHSHVRGVVWATFIRHTTANATGFGSSERPRPARNSCRAAIVMQSTRAPRRIACWIYTMTAASTPRSAGCNRRARAKLQVECASC